MMPIVQIITILATKPIRRRITPRMIMKSPEEFRGREIWVMKLRGTPGASCRAGFVHEQKNPGLPPRILCGCSCRGPEQYFYERTVPARPTSGQACGLRIRAWTLTMAAAVVQGLRL